MVIALLLTFIGAVSLKLIPVEQYPAITPGGERRASCRASGVRRGGSHRRPVETQLNGVDHMLYMESTSSDEGTYRLSITCGGHRCRPGGDRRAKPGGADAGAAPGGGAAEWRVQVRKRASNLLMG